jgi:hypothetical protein
MTKQLLTSGFYDTTLTEKNLWASDFFTKLKQPKQILESEFKLLYKTFYSNDYATNYLLPNTNFNSTWTSFKGLGFYETSYFFFFKWLFLSPGRRIFFRNFFLPFHNFFSRETK